MSKLRKAYQLPCAFPMPGGRLRSPTKPANSRFGYEAAPPKSISSTPATIAYKYLKLDNVDPINGAYALGELSICNSATFYECSAPTRSGVFTSYPHLRDGTYRSWSLYRVITDSNGSNKSNAQTLVNVSM